MLVRLVKNGEGMEFPVMEFGNRPSCATCKWAEKAGRIPRDFESHALVCLVPLDGLAVDCAGPAEIYVKPTFGCVQWEGR